MRRGGFSELRAGVLAILPVAVAVVPFSLLFGALAAQKGLSPLEVLLMSGLVFAGSSQFVALDLWSEPAPWLLLAFSTLMVNARHLLMGASLAPKIAHLNRPRSLLVLFLLADETWALAERRAAERQLTFAYLLGLSGLLWLNWMTWTGLGAVFGALVRNPAAYGFDFVFTAVFLTLVAGFWRGPRMGLAIVVGALVATAVHLSFEGPWYIAAGGLAGALAGAATASPDGGKPNEELPETAE